MRIKAIIVISLLLAMCTYLSGQVSPPIIDCVTNDTVFYNPVNNSCGPFLSYDIFRSPDQNGPYTLIGTVTDPSATFFPDPNSSSTINFYFISPNFDCPGEPVINSDTISNRPPLVGQIISVNVVNNQPVITWNPSPSPETIEYDLFLVTDTGLELILVTPDLTYTDIDRDPSAGSVTYIVVASDACGNRSIFSEPVSSIHLVLGVSGDACDESVNLDWNTHVNTVSQEVWAIDINGNPILLGSLGADDESFFIENFSIPDVSGIFIRAFLNSDQTLFVDSNITEISFVVIVPVEEILITNLNNLNDNNIEINWCWNQDADLSVSRVQFSTSSMTDSINVNFPTPLQPSQEANIALIVGTPDNYTLEVKTVDVCDVLFNSEPINSILLEVNPLSESEVEVSWSPYAYADADLENYQLFRQINGVNELVFEGLATNQTLPSAEVAGEQCFFVVAQATGFLLDGTEKTTTVTSNLDCTSGFPIIRMPNAFNPYGVNSIFRPVIANADAIASYQMNIFSRYGEVLFSTTDTARGWNGRDGLRELPQGVYPYLVEVEVVGGEELEMRGFVLLIR